MKGKEASKQGLDHILDTCENCCADLQHKLTRGAKLRATGVRSRGRWGYQINKNCTQKEKKVPESETETFVHLLRSTS